MTIDEVMEGSYREVPRPGSTLVGRDPPVFLGVPRLSTPFSAAAALDLARSIVPSSAGPQPPSRASATVGHARRRVAATAVRNPGIPRMKIHRVVGFGSR